MSEEQSARPRRRRGLGCLTRIVLVVVVAVGIIVAIGEAFDQGKDAGQPETTYDAGKLEDYQRGDVTYLDLQHIYIVRLPDGEALALYDRSSRQQELGGDCRVAYDETAALTGLSQTPGMVGAFVEECGDLRTVWRVDGTLASGAGYGDLDRFRTTVDASGELLIQTDSRSCTRSVGVPGVPPYRVTRCSGNG